LEKCSKLVVRPPIVEKFLDLVLQCQVQRLLIIEVFDRSKELRQSFAISNVFMKLLESSKDFNQVSEYNRENSNSEEKNKCSKESLNIASRGIISETNCGKRGTGKIGRNNQHLVAIKATESKICQEKLRFIVQVNSPIPKALNLDLVLEIQNSLTNDKEKYSEKVAESKDDHNQPHYFKEILSKKAFFNFVLI
jgi:hypothetical protein